MRERAGEGGAARPVTGLAITAVTLAACVAIVVNAVFLQAGDAARAVKTGNDGLQAEADDSGKRHSVNLVTRITVTPDESEVARPEGVGGDLVRAVQLELARLGLYDAAADGRAGARTRAAVSRYQRANGLPETGEATRQLLDHMLYMKELSQAASYTATAAPAQDRAVANEDVRRVQVALLALGFDAGATDGVMGARTREAIRAFEVHRGLPETGTITPDLARALGITLLAEG